MSAIPHDPYGFPDQRSIQYWLCLGGNSKEEWMTHTVACECFWFWMKFSWLTSMIHLFLSLRIPRTYTNQMRQKIAYPWIPRNGTGLVSEPHNCRVPLCWLSYLSSSFKNNISSLNGITSNNESICSLHICQFPCRVFTCLPSFFSRVCLDISSPGDSVLDWFLGHTLSWWIIIIIIAINHYHDYDLCFELCILTIFFINEKKQYLSIYIL